MFKWLLETAGTTVFKSTCSGNTGGGGGSGSGGGGGGSGGELEVKVATVICDNCGWLLFGHSGKLSAFKSMYRFRLKAIRYQWFNWFLCHHVEFNWDLLLLSILNQNQQVRSSVNPWSWNLYFLTASVSQVVSYNLYWWNAFDQQLPCIQDHSYLTSPLGHTCWVSSPRGWMGYVLRRFLPACLWSWNMDFLMACAPNTQVIWWQSQ